jgi:tRNA (mo5U34)-methyltransferase
MSTTTPSEALERIAEVPLWYHTIEVMPGVTTRGYFDLRPVVEELPWPDVRGQRCLDVGTSDGFLAFELERRGAGEVVATDIADHEQWDWPPRIRAQGIDYLNAVAGARKGAGFEVARALLGSSVELEEISVYDLNPERLGRFDVVVCGSLLLHLRDPLGALLAIHSVCEGAFLSTDQVDLVRSLASRNRPLLRIDGTSDLCHWLLPNAAAHRRMIEAAGFDVERQSRIYSIPFGVAHPQANRPLIDRSTPARSVARRLARRVLTGRYGVPHHAVLARPLASGR